MTKEEISELLKLHQKWLAGEKDGERANLVGANLEGADLRKANLKKADLKKADLSWANLEEANLEGINLEEADLFKANLKKAYLLGANLKKTDLREADLEEADLFKADLRKADLLRAELKNTCLKGTNFEWANLDGTDLRGADLQDANLKEADLGGADIKEATLDGANLDKIKNLPLPDLYILKEAKGKIRAFKLVNRYFGGVFRDGIIYKIGTIVKENEYDNDERVLCGKGINVATLGWCLGKRFYGNKILEVEFAAKDIVAIPYTTDGKFRVRRCKVVKEI